MYFRVATLSRTAAFGLLLLLGGVGQAQRQVTIPNAPVDPGINEFETALVGRWSGVLEYRDYGAGADDTARVKLPTWAAIHLTKGGFAIEYTYDDGPGKTVVESLEVTIAGKPATYTATKAAKPGTTEAAETAVSAIAGLDTLKNGRGTLVLTGPIVENGKPAEARTKLTIRRNLLEITKETRSGTDAFRFRDGYTLTRLTPLYEPPAVH